MKFRIAPQARHDLRRIAQYIAKDNPPRAESYIQELNDKIRAVAKQSMLYPLREEWKPGLRSALFRRYHIVFRIDADVVEFLRILHGARDIPGLLSEN